MNRHHALIHCHEAHRDQVDKCGLPYVFHPLAVGHAVAGLGEDFEVVAYLHDVWEDTAHALPDELDAGPHRGLTDLQRNALHAITRGSHETYREYVLRCRENFVARAVKLADIGHNLSPARMGGLPEREALGLAKRYGWARLALTEGA